jgi:phospholipid/cholesterol/gamma-HCH transport system ATP-binding protein
MSNGLAIRLTDVHKSFGAKKVLDGVSLDIPAGQSTVIIGGSGTGKSVLIKCILGLLRAESGSIAVDGVEVTRLSAGEREAVNRRIGMLFQGSALFDSLRVWQNVAFALIQGRGVPRAEAKPIAIKKLRQVGLTPDVGELFPAELSGGMQKRVALARAIAADPDAIFFDEPTTGLDPIMSDVINELIRRSVGTIGATALSITHDMASVRKIADYVAMLHAGRIVWHGPIGEIDRSGNAYVEQFIHGRAEGPIQMDVRAH